MTKPQVDGIILVLSCQKHMHTRLAEINYREQYDNWKVIYVVGDFFLDKPYELRGNVLWIHCEDSYIHLLKKLMLSIQYVYELFDIRQGILRSGDDLVIHHDRLLRFLRGQKYDYHGQCHPLPNHKEYFLTDVQTLKQMKYDPWMVEYYEHHPEDVENPQHNIKHIHFADYANRPDIKYWAHGVLFYLSNHSCDILLKHMRKLDFNIFAHDAFTDTYPYTIEDCGIAFILYLNDIPFHNENIFYFHPWTIAQHTNKYK